MTQLGLLVGAPLAVLMYDHVRSWPVVIVISVGLSVALTSMAGQALLWFDLANPELVVLLSTGYGVALAWLLGTIDPRRDHESDPTLGGGRSQ